jgi:DNA helicase HerA-like ATPase
MYPMIDMDSLGVIVSVDGDISQVGMYNFANDATFLWKGDILIGPKVGAFMTIHQNDIKIIATVISEKVMDQQNTVKSTQFDNRYSKDSINRIISLKTQGVIDHGKFMLTSEYVPMVGNEVTVTSRTDLESIYDVTEDEVTISIGKSVRERQEIDLSVNKFFGSHIGIFGNTGSGKSNTLHKLYMELFKLRNRYNIFAHSSFYIIDFNGEYMHLEQFGLSNEDIKRFDVNTRQKGKWDKIPVVRKYFFDPDILSILFSARPATQVPFLHTAIQKFLDIETADEFSQLEIGLLKSLIHDFKSVGFENLDAWFKVAEKNGINSLLFQLIRDKMKRDYQQLSVSNGKTEYIDQGGIPDVGHLEIERIRTQLKDVYDNRDELTRFMMFMDFQRIYTTAWNSLKPEYINPLFKRIETTLTNLKNVIEFPSGLSSFGPVNIISLVHANQDTKRLIPMLVSKMVYDEHKRKVSSEEEIAQTMHLIIDEAHNILNAENRHDGDSWKDYRLSVFEEIIKEGRKFGAFLTLASQRPADISPTIISQIHNFFVHRLVNENDLKMLANTMPTLDKSSYSQISGLGQGEAIITGNAMKVPVLVKVDKEEKIRPKSDDVILTDLWEER